MSLVDALLLEPYRDPREVYIALRSDGLKGSGTLDDPYDGATRLGPELQASLTFEGRKFVLGTLFAHGLSFNDVVTITNVHGPAAAWFNKKFKVLEILSDLHVMLSFDDLAVGETAVPSASPVRPPAPPGVPYSYIGLIYVDYTPGTNNKTALPAGARLYWPVARVTVPSNHGLKVFDAATVGNASPDDYEGDYPIFGPLNPTATVFAYRLTFLPPSDFTAPLNCTVTKRIHRFDEVMRTVPFPSLIHLGSGTFETRGYASVYVAHNSDYTQLHTGYILRSGQRLLGSGIGSTILKLVLPVDDLTQTTAVGNPSYPNASYAEVTDLTVDCNADGHVAPFGIFPAPVTCGAVGLGGSFIGIRRVRAINFCTQAYPEGFPIFLGPSSQGGAPTFNIIEDCIVEKPGQNNTHETTLIMNVGNGYANAISPIVRHNYANCNYVDPLDDSRHSSEFLALAGLTVPASNEFTLTTKRPHHRKAGQNILLTGVIIAGTVPKVPHPYFFGSFRIKSLDGTTPETKMTCEFINPPTSFPTPDFSDAYIGVDYHAPGAFSGTGCVTEGNAVFDCPEAYYADTGSTRDAVVRDNYYSGVLRGVNFSLGVSDPQLANSLTLSVVGGKFIATFEIAIGTPLLQVAVDDVVLIGGAFVGGVLVPEGVSYNGTIAVLSVSPDKKKFTYEMKTNPATDAEIGHLISFQSRNQVRRFIYENNLCDLSAFDINSENVNLVPRGMQTVAYADGPPFLFPATIVRDNVFRHIDNAPSVVDSSGNFLYALRIGSFETTLIDGNLIGLSAPHLIHHLNSGTVSAFNNRTPGGAAIPLFEVVKDTGQFQQRDSLEDKINDSLAMSLL